MEESTIYIGGVGTGFSDQQSKAMFEELEPLRRRSSPSLGDLPSDARRDALWVLSSLVVEVRHQLFTED